MGKKMADRLEERFDLLKKQVLEVKGGSLHLLYLPIYAHHHLFIEQRIFSMGNCISCIAGNSNQTPGPIPEPEPDHPHPDPDQSTIGHLIEEPDHPFPDPDPDPDHSTIGHLIDGDTSFLRGNVSGNIWFSMANTNFSTWISQASGALATIWGEDNEFLAAIDEGDLPDGGTAIDSQLRAFTLEQLKAATFNFRNDMVLGKGGFGSVYKGWLKEKVPSRGTRKRAIAVKRLDDSSSKQGFPQWRTEVGFLARLSHPNIVKLLGYCQENEELLIVYEFLEKGSLNYHLFGMSSDQILSWETRLKIAIGMAQALCYLHTMEKPIIFRDFKSSNVLLDKSYTPKISDFGLAKWGPKDDFSYVRGHVMGTVGYVAPDYVASGNLNAKSDVYSYGVVLLEMLTGLRAIDKQRRFVQLVDWAKPKLCEKNKLKRIMDSKLKGKYSIEQALEIAQLAVRCLNYQFRPSMKEVVETLERIEARRR